MFGFEYVTLKGSHFYNMSNENTGVKFAMKTSFLVEEGGGINYFKEFDYNGNHK